MCPLVHQSYKTSTCQIFLHKLALTKVLILKISNKSFDLLLVSDIKYLKIQGLKMQHINKKLF